MALLRLTILSLVGTALLTIFLYPNCLSLPAAALKSTLKHALSALRSFRRDKDERTGSSFGLKISLILASFYAAQGLATSLNRQAKKLKLRGGSKSKSNLPALSMAKIPFHFMEIPVLLSLIVFGSVILPNSIVSKYTTVLAGFAPVMPLLEVASLLTVVMAAGRSWTPKIVESHDFVKVAVVAACFASFALSSSVFYFIYANFRLSTLIASLLSSLLTLLIVQVIACCQIDHATITDPALIFPYISYNLILITLKSGMRALLDHQRDPHIYPTNPQKFLKLIEFLFPAATPGKFPSLTRQILQTFFSPVLIFHLLLQLALMTVASSTSTGDAESDDSEPSLLFRFRQFFVNNLWPLFGKSFLVIIYTISWLEQCHPDVLKLTHLSDSSGFWRWIVIGCSVAWYSKHLLLDGQKNTSETGTSSYTCDKAFWRQFHNLKDD